MRVPGLGVRVRPSGHRGYVYQCKVDGRAKRVTLGPAALKTVAEVRRECLEIEVSKKSDDRAMSARGKTPTFATFVAGPWKSACFDRYKPATRRSVRGSLRTQLLPAFGDLPLDRIDRMRAHRWFDEYSRTAPGGANHALDTFRRIMNHAIALGHVETNPTRDVKPNPRAALTRFLSLEEIACLHRVLDGYAPSRASRRRQADIIRLLLLTGCRKGEIVNLRWREVEGDTLNLADSKTGPRKVFLNTPARAVVERQPRTDSPFVFPSPRDPERACSPDSPLSRQAPTVPVGAKPHYGICRSELMTMVDERAGASLTPPYRAIQGMPLQQDGARHGLQTRPGGTGQLAPPRRTQPVAQADRRRKVRRRNRSRQATTSSRRPTQTVTKIRL